MVDNLSYDPVANLTTADLAVYPDTFIGLGFSGVGPRVRNLRVLRDGYAPTQTFTTPFLTRLAPFRVIRFMDYLRTNNNPVQTWSERTLPTAPSQARPRGRSLGIHYPASEPDAQRHLDQYPSHRG